MIIVPESAIEGLVDRAATFEAVEAVFAAMASGTPATSRSRARPCRGRKKRSTSSRAGWIPRAARSGSRRAATGPTTSSAGT